MIPLDPLEFPLHGRRLIEASAGTGKTHAIGSFVLRALLGRGPTPTPPRLLGEILIVTFTRAATRELRARLQQRLVELRDALRAQLEDAPLPADPLLAALITDSVDPRLDLLRIEQALLALDDAAIFTIHGFCQRVLQDSAFESGNPFDAEFTLDDRTYRERAVRDFWRREVYPLSDDLSALLRGVAADPDALLAMIRAQLSKPFLVVEGGDATREIMETADAVRPTLDAVRKLWREEDIAGQLERSNLSKAKGEPARPEAVRALEDWSNSNGMHFAAETESGDWHSIVALLRPFTSDRLPEAKRNQKGEVLDIPEFSAAVDAAVEALEHLEASFLARALTRVREGMRREKSAERVVAPDDLLHGLHAGLQGAGGKALAGRIRSRWPLALVDEFQDTDPLQYRIFDAVWPDVRDTEPGDPALVMIGDPKQAIYAFRGADIHAYLDARRGAGPDRTHVMEHNWRSSAAMLRAVETLFTACDDPFLFKGIDFIPVAAARSESGAAGAALQFLYLPSEDGFMAQKQAKPRLASACAERLAQWLQDGEPLNGVPMQAGDVAVLVNDRFEALHMREALHQQGIASALNHRTSVFLTAESEDLGWLIEAIAEPRHEAAVKRALATPLVGWSLPALHTETAADEGRWQGHLDRFGTAHRLWHQHGFMAALQRILMDYRVPGRMLADDPVEGPRRLTDLRHLAELVQERSIALGSPERVLRWYRQELGEPAETDDQQRRLESDENLVRIVTVHASKGLEYPVVLLPFGIRARELQDVVWHREGDTGSEAVLDLLPTDATTALAEQEALGESLRLLYVAITRARYLALIGVANVRNAGRGKASDMHRTALGHLLFSERGDVTEAVSDSGLHDALQALAARCEDITVQTPRVESGSALDGPHSLPPAITGTAQARLFSGEVDSRWRIGSYSALVSHDDGGALQPGFQDEGRDDARVLEQEEGSGVVQIAATFPRGPQPGTCIHAMLENWPQDGDVRAHLRNTLDAHGLMGQDVGEVQRWMETVRGTPLGVGTTLAEIAPERCVAEMEFHLAVPGVETRAITELLGDHGYVHSPLNRSWLEGLLRGFIDLVVEHDDRLHVVDYKSNWLGSSPADYDAAAMANAVREHRYDLQYLLYAVALRRLVRLREPGADADARVGDVLYLFVRGMDGSGATGIHRDAPAPGLLRDLDALLLGGALP